MKEIIRYILETLICSGILFGAYRLLLQHRTHYLAARLYLLSATVLAAIIPLLHIPVWPGRVIIASYETQSGPITATILPVEAFDPRILVWIIYGGGILLLLFSTLRQILAIRQLRRGATSERIGRCTLMRPLQPISSFSFFRTIYISHIIPPQIVPAIVAHEMSHIRHRHSLERILMESFKTLLWWNPFVWLISRDLTEVEEFEADHDVITQGYDAPTYIDILVKQLFGYSPEIANSLRNSLTKKRLKMITTQKKSRYALLRLAATLLCATALVVAFSFTAQATVIRTASDQSPTTFSTDSLTYMNNDMYVSNFNFTPSSDDDNTMLIVEDGQITDFSIDPITGKRFFKAASDKVRFRIVGVSDFTPEIKAQFGELLQGKLAITFFESEEYTAKMQAEGRSNTVAEVNTNNDDDPFVTAEVMPAFQGGDINTFRTWVNNEIRYPAQTAQDNHEGKVVAQFIVERDGTISNITILRSPNKPCSDEVKRVLLASPKWTPGKDSKGNPVRVSFTLPVEFSLGQ